MIFKTSKQVYIHVDCDCFFASCEILRNPELKGKKVCVGGEIIIACSYEAKRLGVKTGTPIWEAKSMLGKDAYYFIPDHNYYTEISNLFMKYLQKNTLKIEPYSIDEAFCEITGLAQMNKISLGKYVKNLQKDIFKNVGIPVSIGVANTRIKAKIYSKLNKPFGIYIGYNQKQEKDLFKKLALKYIPYIGKAYQERLKYRCKYIYDYIGLGFRYIQKDIGKTGTTLWLELCGVNAFVVKKSSEPKSIGRSRSFNKIMTSDLKYLKSQLINNFEIVFEEITVRKYEIKKITVMLRTKDFITLSYDFTLADYTNIHDDILKKMINLFLKHYNKNITYRSTGIVLSKFRSYLPRQMSLFDKATRSKDNKYKLTQAINAMNTKYGKHKVTFGISMQGEGFNAKHSITK